MQREGNLHRNPAQQNEQEEGNKQTDDRGNQVNQLDDVGGCHDLIAVDADCRTEQDKQPQDGDGNDGKHQKVQQDGKAQTVGIVLKHPPFGHNGRRRSKAIPIHIGIAVWVILPIAGRVGDFFAVMSHIKILQRGKSKKLAEHSPKMSGNGCFCCLV